MTKSGAAFMAIARFICVSQFAQLYVPGDVSIKLQTQFVFQKRSTP